MKTESYLWIAGAIGAFFLVNQLTKGNITKSITQNLTEGAINTGKGAIAGIWNSNVITSPYDGKDYINVGDLIFPFEKIYRDVTREFSSLWL